MSAKNGKKGEDDDHLQKVASRLPQSFGQTVIKVVKTLPIKSVHHKDSAQNCEHDHGPEKQLLGRGAFADLEDFHVALVPPKKYLLASFVKVLEMCCEQTKSLPIKVSVVQHRGERLILPEQLYHFFLDRSLLLFSPYLR